MITKNTVVHFVARHRLRFAAGAGLIGSFISIFSILTFLKVWETTFEFYGIPMLTIYVGAPIGYFLICWFVGFMYDRKGFWKAETTFTNKNQNTEFLTMCDDVKEIKGMLLAQKKEGENKK
jgi:hypothetical protein